MSKKARKKTPKKASKVAARKPATKSSKAAAKKSTAKKATVKKPTVRKGRPAGTRSAVVKASQTRAVAKPPVAAVRTASKAATKSATETVKGAAVPPVGRSGLTEGAKAPSFRLPRDGGQTVSLADFAGQRLVLFFYPRADTPGCTKEAIDFTRLATSFADNGTAIVGVSADPLRAQESFRNKHELTTPLASDEQHDMLEAYGAWGEKSMYGKTFLGVLRTTVLIGTDGRVEKIWRQVKVDGHADEVLKTVQAS